MTPKDSIRIDIRRVYEDNVPELFELHSHIISCLEDRQLYRRNTQDFFERHAKEEGLTLGIFTPNQKLVAYALLRFPRLASDNLGRDVGLADGVLDRVVHLEECGVHPEFRGHGLQSELTRRRLEIAHALGYKYAFTTVSPKNVPSLRAHFRHGLAVVAAEQKYGDLLRFVLGKNLGSQFLNLTDRVVICAADDFLGARALIASGMRGIGVSKAGNGLIFSHGGLGSAELQPSR